MADWRKKLRALRSRFIKRGQAPAPATPTNAVTEHPQAKSKQVQPNFPDTKPIAPSPEYQAVSPKSRADKNEAQPPKAEKEQLRTQRAASSRKKAISPRPIAINFGIDFGTSFTKVCYRDVGSETSGIVFIGHNFSNALAPSVVTISKSGRLYIGDKASLLKAPISVPFLKMRLAGLPFGNELPSCNGINISDETAVKALSAWFLASIIKRSQKWISDFQPDLLKNRKPVWSANIGVPVEHYDSDALKIFEEVLGVAWLWVKSEHIPGTVQAAVNAYQGAVSHIEKETTDFHAIPEIAAAVQSFVMSREAVPGIYVYFDIGGGTIDGVAFNFLNDFGERQINFYSGKVEPLGVSAIGSKLNSPNAATIDTVELERLLNTCSSKIEEAFIDSIHRLVGKVVMKAKKIDGRNWQEDAIQSSDYQRKFIGRLSPECMRPLVIFIGGGGATSEWYKKAIASTYDAFKHYNAGIPPYELLEVPQPSDFRARDQKADKFTRFAISYGLSIPSGEGPEFRLPSQFDEEEKPLSKKRTNIVDYADSKDVHG